MRIPTDDINKFLEDMHDLAKKDNMPVWPDDEDDYLELIAEFKLFMQGMPKYKSPARLEIEEHPSLLGAFGVLFLRLEDAYLKLAEMGSDGKMEPEEIIREHAFDIGMCIFKYVSKAMVHATVTTVTVGLTGPVAALGVPVPTFGTGAGAGGGKMS